MAKLYRPDTDTQRIQALNAGRTKYVNTAVGSRAFSADTFTRLDAMLPIFSLEMQQRGAALSAQSAVVVASNPQRRMLRLYVSHFIGGLNNAILREELPATDRALYQLDVNSGMVPKLTTDLDLMQWADNIITGEAARIAAGGTAMSNPSAAQVEAKRNILAPLLIDLSAKKDAYDKEQEDVAALLLDVDDIITDMWDEVLFTFRKDDAASMRRKAREWGVVYRPDAGEVPSPEDFSLKGKVAEYMTLNPLVGVEVYIIEADQFTTTDPNGDYIFGTLASGSYTVRFRLMGYYDYTQPNVAIANGVLSTLDVQMKREMPMP
jgi:hypothetical protein